MGEELKACPFCGSKAEMVTNRSGDNLVRRTNRQCAAKTRPYHENEAGARMAWNKRAEPTCDREALLALEADIEESLSRAETDERNCAVVTSEAFADIAGRIRKAVTDDADR